MVQFNKEDVQKLPKINRLNLINSCTGYKSANLIGTKSKDGKSNVAIFSSITHLGSDPALLSFILRPATVPRNSYTNMKETGYFTVNHITEEIIAQAHQTSAAYDFGISEFKITGLEEKYHNEIHEPFVAKSPVQILCKYLSEYEIKENNCIHVLASIETIFCDEKLITKDNWLQLEKGNIVAINGLDGYCLPKLIDRFEYARPNTETKSMLKNGS
ncbi:flavin reductase [Flavobacterium gelidilacus]|jgi:flavin reductase (DIM6/NTAB) family NADH-FMN oxidoreductase RutF|uniref:flavin reductase family protein n=1 Tax=Flavobacterium gelidilacus TaxID=206041 RepID=UPI0003FDB7D8|nr:flavin reductase [Flavobacterium gelidilacus]